jgi:hypothetical protein
MVEVTIRGGWPDGNYEIVRAVVYGEQRRQQFTCGPDEILMAFQVRVRKARGVLGSNITWGGLPDTVWQ